MVETVDWDKIRRIGAMAGTMTPESLRAMLTPAESRAIVHYGQSANMGSWLSEAFHAVTGVLGGAGGAVQPIVVQQPAPAPAPAPASSGIDTKWILIGGGLLLVVLLLKR